VAVGSSRWRSPPGHAPQTQHSNIRPAGPRTGSATEPPGPPEPATARPGSALASPARPAGSQQSARGIDLLRGSFVFVEEAAEDGLAPDPLQGEIGGGMVRPGRVQLAAAVGSSSVVVPGVLGQDAAQAAFAEDQDPVGELGPGGAHEPFRMSIRARAPGRGLDSLDARAGQSPRQTMR